MNPSMDIYKGIVFNNNGEIAAVFQDTKLHDRFRLNLNTLRVRIENLSFINGNKEFLYDLSEEYLAERDLIRAELGLHETILLYKGS